MSFRFFFSSFFYFFIFIPISKPSHVKSVPDAAQSPSSRNAFVFHLLFIGRKNKYQVLFLHFHPTRWPLGRQRSRDRPHTRRPHSQKTESCLDKVSSHIAPQQVQRKVVRIKANTTKTRILDDRFQIEPKAFQ